MPTQTEAGNSPSQPTRGRRASPVLPIVRRQSYSHLSSRVAVASSIPPVALVSADVLCALTSLLSPTHLPETHWRCVATLFALSCIRDYRHSLVRLGATQLLVREANSFQDGVARSSSGASAHVVRCCAGALCNLTIVPSAAVDANASLMVQHDAVPALIHLAKSEHDDVREFCTLALSNLSAQSPTLEAGAVSALLTLSMRSSMTVTATAPSSSSISTAAASTAPSSVSPVPSLSALDLVPGVTRPPRVTDERFKRLSALPEFPVPPESMDALLELKFEAERLSIQPPPPHLPTIPADLQLIGGLGARHAAPAIGASTAALGASPNALSGDKQRDEMLLRRHRSASIGDLLSLSPVSTPSTGSRGDPSDELRAWPTLSFPKADEVEGRALLLLPDGDEDGDGDKREASGDAAPSDVKPTLSTDAVSRRDARLEHDDAMAVSNSSKSNKQQQQQKALSPLARVVVRKTQTVTATKKLKELRTRSEHHSKLAALSASATSLPLATVVEDSNQEAKASGGDVTQVGGSGLRMMTMTEIGNGNGVSKSASLSKLTMAQVLGDMRVAAQAARASESTAATVTTTTSASASTSAVEVSAAPSVGNACPPPSLAEMAAAAGLYAPATTTTAAATTEKSKQQQQQQRQRNRQQSKAKTRKSASSMTATTEPAPAPSEQEQAQEQEQAKPVVVEDVAAQARRLGLWC
ncbi:hypothetical protein PINS_up014310 [Pythium insidiosum]|nr:hypothetical protein PINS_up014310 [Pythium insidiosum]